MRNYTPTKALFTQPETMLKVFYWPWLPMVCHDLLLIFNSYQMVKWVLIFDNRNVARTEKRGVNDCVVPQGYWWNVTRTEKKGVNDCVVPLVILVERHKNWEERSKWLCCTPGYIGGTSQELGESKECCTPGYIGGTVLYPRLYWWNVTRTGKRGVRDRVVPPVILVGRHKNWEERSKWLCCTPGYIGGTSQELGREE